MPCAISLSTVAWPNVLADTYSDPHEAAVHFEFVLTTGSDWGTNSFRGKPGRNASIRVDLSLSLDGIPTEKSKSDPFL